MKSYLHPFDPSTRDAGARQRLTLTPEFSDDRPTIAVLTAGVSQAVLIPAGAVYVSMTGNGEFYAWHGTGATALAIPGSTSATNTGELSPGDRRIPAGSTHLIFIAPLACRVALVFAF